MAVYGWGDRNVVVSPLLLFLCLGFLPVTWKSQFLNPSGLFLTMTFYGCYALSTTTIVVHVWSVVVYVRMFVWWMRHQKKSMMMMCETSVSMIWPFMQWVKKMNESNRFMMRNFEWWLLSSVSCAFIISSDAVGGRASAHFPSAMNFWQQIINLVLAETFPLGVLLVRLQLCSAVDILVVDRWVILLRIPPTKPSYITW